MKTLLKKIIGSCLFFILLFAGLVYFFLNTTTGLSTLITLAGHYLPGTLTTGSVKGRLSDGFSIDNIRYRTQKTTLTINQIHARIQLVYAPHWQLQLQNLETSAFKIQNPQGSILINPLHLTALWSRQGLTSTLTSQIILNKEEPWQLTSNVKGSFPWNWQFDARLTPVHGTAQHQHVSTQLTVEGNILDKNHGTMTLTVAPGYIQLPNNDLVPELQFKGGKITVSLTPQALKGSGSLAIDEHKQFNLLFKLPHFDLNKGLVHHQPLSAQLSLLIDSFDFLHKLSPEISTIKGQLRAVLHARGTINKPVIESTLHLEEGKLALPQLGLDLSSINFSLFAHKQDWKAEGFLLSNNKKLTLKGNGSLNTPLTGIFQLAGVEIPIINTKEYQINVSPQLNIRLSDSSLTIEGSLLVPYAQIKPHNFSNSIALSEDVVFLSEKKHPASTPFKTNMDVHIVMGDKVSLAFKGLNALLVGTIDVKQRTPGPISATGELTVKKGTYQAYAQDLTIEQGQLLFTGGRLDNPGINIRAAKKIDTSLSSASDNQSFDLNNTNLHNLNVRGFIEVGIEVTGRINQPKITLFANPAMLSQADILSMMILGRPASQANKAGGQLLLAAVSSMNLGSGTQDTQLLEQLKKNLGVDLNIQTNNNYNALTNQMTDSTSVVVGKSLSKRIYLSYNVGLSPSDPNVLVLKYLLNKFYSIQVSSSTKSNAIDFLYTSSASEKKG